jgi:hypothetical protein
MPDGFDTNYKLKYLSTKYCESDVDGPDQLRFISNIKLTFENDIGDD